MYFSTSSSLIVVLLAAGQALSRTADKVCTSRSAKSLEWKIRSFDYHSSDVFSTPAHQVAYGFTNFTLENTALSYSFKCDAVSAQQPNYFYDGKTWDCVAPADGEGDRSSFLFDRESGLLKINQAWGCARDGSKFQGAGEVKLDLKCKENKYKNEHWEMGQTYAKTEVNCEKVDVPVMIQYLNATA
ncbi:hypothetical protein QQS21_006064 [Conoideocrella luteorostrata]|uniref:AA1-like domain-containing protein n=1 Tax=Conoideocrella luteorostrata TaxID=1105319 RepID=A0AAJ0CNC0_9HYPO|nr:hypothetical protein QQS21_006064 [Conoideocrella luteorostrata]